MNLADMTEPEWIFAYVALVVFVAIGVALWWDRRKGPVVERFERW
jgi:hypothetical protein